MAAKEGGGQKGAGYAIVADMLEVLGSLAGNVIPREALEVVGVGGKVDAGAEVGE